MSHRSTILVRKLFFLVLVIIPFIPVAVILKWMSPVGFIECAIAILISMVLYIAFVILELYLIWIVIER